LVKLRALSGKIAEQKVLKLIKIKHTNDLSLGNLERFICELEA